MSRPPWKVFLWRGHEVRIWRQGRQGMIRYWINGETENTLGDHSFTTGSRDDGHPFENFEQGIGFAKGILDGAIHFGAIPDATVAVPVEPVVPVLCVLDGGEADHPTDAEEPGRSRSRPRLQIVPREDS